VKHTKIFFICCLLFGCSSYSELSSDEQCVEWARQEVTERECTRAPYVTCFERTKFRLVCLRREKIT
jgi:hypothetical protein